MRFNKPNLFTKIASLFSTLIMSTGVTSWSNNNEQLHLGGNEVTASSGAAEPQKEDDVYKGFPAMTFNGTSQFFNFNGTGMADESYSIFIVEQRSSDRSDNYFMGSVGGSQLKLGYKNDTTIVFGYNGNEEEITVEAFDPTDVKPVVHAFIFSDGNVRKYYRNGSLMLNSVANTSPLTSYNNATIGRDGGNYYEGAIFEIAIYNRDLSLEEIQSINGYFDEKWLIEVVKNEEGVGTGCNISTLGYVDANNLASPTPGQTIPIYWYTSQALTGASVYGGQTIADGGRLYYSCSVTNDCGAGPAACGLTTNTVISDLVCTNGTWTGGVMSSGPGFGSSYCASASTGTGTGTGSGSGSGGINCSGAGCAAQCSSWTSCNVSCSGPGCNMTCTDSSCGNGSFIQCSGPGCNIASSSVWNASCTQVGCTLTCNGGSTDHGCAANCSGGAGASCTVTCSGTGCN